MLGLRAVATPQRCVGKRRREMETVPVTPKKLCDAHRSSKCAKKVLEKRLSETQHNGSIDKDHSDDPEFDDAVRTVLRIHTDVLATTLQSNQILRDDHRRRLAELRMTKQYDQLWNSVMVLLPWVLNKKVLKRRTNRRSYNVGHFVGQRPATAQKKLAGLLQCAREDSKEGCARDALCAALATLASREEMCWLDAYDKEKPARGWFAHSLVDPSSAFRLSLTSELQPRPVSLIVTHQLPISAALSMMDASGPFFDCPYKMCHEQGYHFALQDIIRDRSGAKNKESARVDSASLFPEPKFRKLFGTKAPVLLLDAYVALAPRAHVRKHGLSDVTKAELLEVLRDAKKRGQAVIFQVGGDEPHVLAEKVYLQPQIRQFGLRCGYLRCCSSPWASWEREKPWKDRPLIGLQMP